MLSRKCFFLKATSREEHILVCEDCFVAMRAYEIKDYGNKNTTCYGLDAVCYGAPPS
jgi:hypothetical protein